MKTISRGGLNGAGEKLDMRNEMTRFGLLLAFTLMGVGCGSGDVDGCDFRSDETPPRCQERVRNVPDPTGMVSELFKGTCEVAQGTFLGDGCPAEGRVAGCKLNGGGGAEETTNWFYTPATRADVEMECDDGSVVDP